MKKKALTTGEEHSLTCPYCRCTTFKPKWDGGWATYRKASGWFAQLFGFNYPERLEATCRACGEISWIPAEAMEYLSKMSSVDWVLDR